MTGENETDDNKTNCVVLKLCIIFADSIISVPGNKLSKP